MQKTFLAEVQIMTADQQLETEFIESSDYTSSKKFARSLDDEGYIVKKITPIDKYSMW